MDGGRAGAMPQTQTGTHGGARGGGRAANSPASNSQTVIKSSARAIVGVWHVGKYST